jgi:5-methylcytosine-specific restriction endonuclease McrA
VARAQSDIANTALRIFLQEMGAAYDRQRGLVPYESKHFAEVRDFFRGRCCYCGTELEPSRIAQDHLVPMNKTGLGLHAWGNIVPACLDCNAKKQGREWHEFLVRRAGVDAAERYERVREFVTKYKYSPEANNLRNVAEDLYAEIGAVAMTLISTKVKLFRETL